MMNSPSTFVGKCVTLLIGGVLSYLTVLHPDAEILANAIFGKSQPAVRAEPDLDASGLNLGPAAPKQQPVSNGSRFGQSAANVSAASKSAERIEPSSLDQIDQISMRLRQLGASYLLLEKLPRPQGDQFRVRCDLANELQPVKCCFEATRGTALAAMQDVLRAVVNYDPQQQRHSDVPTTSVASGR